MYFIHNDKKLSIEVKQKKIKHAYIRMKDHSTLLVSVNHHVSEKNILDMLEKHRGEVERIIEKFHRNEWKNLNEIQLLGGIVPVTYHIGRNAYRLGDQLNLSIKEDDDHLKQAMIDRFYKEYAKEFLNDRLMKAIKTVGVSHDVTCDVREMKTRWGSCHVNKNKIVLNRKLIKKRIELIDYVIVHELIHFQFPNHSKYFWNEVSRYVPDYRELRKELNR